MEDTDTDDQRFPPGEEPPQGSPAARLGRVLERLDRLEDKIDRLRAEGDPERLLSREEAAERLNISVRTLDTLRAVKVKRRVRFHPDALEAYIRRHAEEGRT